MQSRFSRREHLYYVGQLPNFTRGINYLLEHVFLRSYIIVRFSFKIFWNRRHKNFVCLCSRNFNFAERAIFSVLCQAAIAGKREEKFCNSFLYFLQARKSFKPDGLLVVSENTLFCQEETFFFRVLKLHWNISFNHQEEQYNFRLEHLILTGKPFLDFS